MKSHCSFLADIKNGGKNAGKPNKLLSIMTVCRHDLNNGVIAYMLHFG